MKRTEVGDLATDARQAGKNRRHHGASETTHEIAVVGNGLLANNLLNGRRWVAMIEGHEGWIAKGRERNAWVIRVGGSTRFVALDELEKNKSANTLSLR